MQREANSMAGGLARFMDIQRQRTWFIDRFGLKRPLPPPGYIEFKMTQRTDKDGMLMSPNCPNCKRPAGFVFGGSDKMFVDPGAQAFYEQEVVGNDSYEALCKEYEGDMIKCHWSRFSTGHCCKCGCLIWDDLVSGYAKVKGRDVYVPSKCYYLPKAVSAQVSEQTSVSPGSHAR